MQIITDSSDAFLSAYLNNSSPTGFEYSGQKLWLDYIKPYIQEWHADVYGTVYGVINPGQEYKVAIEAHADEISWFVNYITDDGFIYVVRNGGSDHMIAPSKRVNIYTRKGIVRGVFGWPAIHTRNGKDTDPMPSVENIFVDVGAKSKEAVAEMGIHVGCVMTFVDELEIINDSFYCGRALDNRMGGFCIAEVARLIHEQKIQLPYTLYVVNSVQEEVGLNGARMIAHRLDPDLAIVTDVTHDTRTPLMTPKKQGDVSCGEGPSITYAPAVHQKLLDIIFEAAHASEIPYQREAASRVTGTDTDAFAYSRNGIPSALISLPLRYMHTTVEMAHRQDVENVIRLILETLKRIDGTQKFTYF